MAPGLHKKPVTLGSGMDNVLMAGLSRQIALMREVDALASNIANASTTGFKSEFLAHAAISKAPAHSNVGPREVLFAETAQVLRDFGQGPLEQTGRDFDIALDGEGFFGVNTPDGQQYTRDGAFALDPDGKLVTKAGNPVLTDAGSEIQIPPGAGALVITEDGAIRAGDVVLGKIGIFKFPEPQRLVPIGGNLYADGGQKAETVDRGTRVAQGYLESSNVRPVVEMTRLLEASRQYEAVTRSMRASEDLRSRAIERLGRPQ